MPTILERYKEYQSKQKLHPNWYEEALNKLPPHTPVGSVFSFRVINPFSQEGQDIIEKLNTHNSKGHVVATCECEVCSVMRRFRNV